MPSKLNKVQKHVTKKKGGKITSLHENSRDAKRIRRASARDDRVSRVEALKQKSNAKWIERISFFQDNMPDTLHPMGLEEIQELVSALVSRYDEEIEQLKSERRAGRPASTRQTHLEQAAEAEKKEFETGFWMPNLQHDQTLERLDSWKGDWSSLSNLRFVRLSESGELKESQFPPRGAS